MSQLFIVLVVALVAAALVFGITVLIMGGDQGLEPTEPDGRSMPLPGSRPLTEADLGKVRFDVTVRGYRMTQVDQALRRAAYDLGYKEELIGVLEAEVEALRAGRLEEADSLRDARETAARPARATDDADLTGAAAGETARGGGPGPAPPPGPDRTADSAPAQDSGQPSGSGSAAAGDDGGNGDGDQDRRGWRIGSGTMSDPAAEPAK
jgi:DivIVA domain-containing protein